MLMRLLGSVWRDGRVLRLGDVVDVGQTDAERLAILGVAEPVAVSEPETPAQDTVSTDGRQGQTAPGQIKRKRGRK